MATLSVDEQVEAITHVGVQGLGHSRADVEAMIAKCDGDRLALNALRVKLNTKHRSACARINKAAEGKVLDGYAEAGRVLHDATKEQAARDRRSRRQAMTPGCRVDRVLTELNAMSTVRAVSMPDPNLTNVKIPKAAGWQAPAEAPQVDVGPLLNAITVIVEQLEGVLDAQRGLVAPHELATLPGEVKDMWILTRLRGVRSDVIAQAFPWLGRQRKIEMVRREAGQRPIDGTDREPQEAAA